MKSTRDTIAMLREQAAHPNLEGWSEIAPIVVLDIADDLEEALGAGSYAELGFVVGARVRWTSQSSGSRTTKTGKIEHVIAAGKSVWGIPGLREPGQPRPHESYLVRSDAGRLYWPRVSTLEVIS